MNGRCRREIGSAAILLPAFEFDEAKSRADAEEHGISVHEVWLWQDSGPVALSRRCGRRFDENSATAESTVGKADVLDRFDPGDAP